MSGKIYEYTCQAGCLLVGVGVPVGLFYSGQIEVMGGKRMFQANRIAVVFGQADQAR